jgi:hypothetical protein
MEHVVLMNLIRNKKNEMSVLFLIIKTGATENQDEPDMSSKLLLHGIPKFVFRKQHVANKSSHGQKKI